MKQILQNLKTGEMEVAELPAPRPGRGEVLISTRVSLISPGTERMLVEFSQANLLRKARQQPEKVRQVLDKIRTDGLLPTLETVFRKLDEPIPLGYSNAGVVLEVGAGVEGFQPGDRVVSNGPHAEVVCIPKNLCARIPDGVGDEEAAFTVLGSIALHGVRLAQPTLGEKFLVFGTGLVGLLAVQFLRASGCRVMAVDLNRNRLDLAGEFGALTVNPAAGGDPVAAAETWTGGRGVDGVLLATDAPQDNEIIHQAAAACRQRGRIVSVGKVGLQLRHADFFKKEITFQLSASYGPGRYDEKYEQGGQDYPYGYVRWTEQRNFVAVLAALETGVLRVRELVTDRFPVSEAVGAYEKIFRAPESLAVILRYAEKPDRSPRVVVTDKPSPPLGKATVGFIGAGNFAKAVLLPALAKTDARIAYVASRSGASGQYAARKFGAGEAVTDYRLILDDPEVGAVFIVVGHHLHGEMVCRALRAGKHVFVEKPLCLNPGELEEIARAVAESPGRQLLVGFNRRFSPHTVRIKDWLAGRSGPLCMSMTVNAGAIPPESWHQDPELGGGRIIGEGCHFIDLLAFLTGSPVRSVSAAMVGEGPAVRDDKMAITLSFTDGSIGVVNYFANGPKSYPKETLEVFSDRRVARLENFRVTRGYGFPRPGRFRTRRQDKGHQTEVRSFIERVAGGGDPLIPFGQLANATLASFAAVASAREGRVITLTDDYPALAAAAGLASAGAPADDN